ncbi:MAG: DegT/DnrJ/EryC1/StrS family aminotransferase [Mariprofundaceae bacterium]|nr:DegT/DnrJ/EryC1/StrS family aminotransferase [Mariprofundaceae bacterium]
MIPHSRPIFDDRFIHATTAVVRSSYTSEGEQSRELEQEVLKQCQQDDAVAVDSGTSALMLAIRALKTQQNIQKVGIPAYACASLWFAVRAAGCTPILMDCGEDLRLDVDYACKLAPTLDAVVLVHPFGMVDPLVAETWDCPVIEDIAQAAGATFQNKAVGSFGDVVIASFYATKPWGGAYGGMVLASTAMCDAVRRMSHPDDVNLALPYVGHHQLSNIHASLALMRLQCSAAEKKSRQQMMQWLDMNVPEPLQQSIHQRKQGNAFRYIVRIDGDVESCLQALHAQGLGAARPVQYPLHDAEKAVLHGAEKAWKDCISLPIFPNMTTDEYTLYAQGLSRCFP